jgi:hypothetical protein
LSGRAGAEATEAASSNATPRQGLHRGVAQQKLFGMDRSDDRNEGVIVEEIGEERDSVGKVFGVGNRDWHSRR